MLIEKQISTKTQTPKAESFARWRYQCHQRRCKRSFRPAIAEPVPDISGYDTIFVGFPIWWYKAPTIINTFLESVDFSGKTIILFATSGGSRFGDTVKYLKNSVSDTAVIKEGRILTSAQGYVISAWLKELGIIG